MRWDPELRKAFLVLGVFLVLVVVGLVLEWLEVA